MIGGQKFMKAFVMIVVCYFSFLNSVLAEEKTWNVKLDTLSFIFGGDIELEYKVNKHLSIAPHYNRFKLTNVDSFDEDSRGLGINAYWYIKESMQQGQFIKVGLTKRKTATTEHLGEVYTGNYSTSMLCASYGKLWLWENFNIGGEIEYCDASDSAYVATSPSGSTRQYSQTSGSNIYPKLSIGYAW